MPTSSSCKKGVTKIKRDDLEFGDSLGNGATAAVCMGRWKSQNMVVAIKEFKVVNHKYTNEEVS